MQTFLDEVAKKMISSKFEMDKIKIIVPNNRSINFLKGSLKKVINQPFLSPEIISISEFIADLSGISSIKKIDLLFSFYSVYKKHTPKAKLESFNQFFNWAPLLLQEFNEIDTQLVNAEELFSYIRAIESIELWGTSEKEEENKIYFKRKEKLVDYYKGLYEVLVKKQKGYSGLQSREAVENLAFYLEQELPHHLFIGFNALTKAEETIIQELISEGKADIIWDIDKTFFQDPYHSAGYFIRQYFREWNVLKKEGKPQLQEFFSGAKKIEIISSAKNSIQAKIAVQIATELHKENPKKSTAIVLGDESLLQLVLSVLPEKDFPWNITMGYPLKETTLCSFFKLFFELHNICGEYGFPIKKIHEFIKLGPVRIILKSSINNIEYWLEKFNQNYITFEQLSSKGSIMTLLFSPYKGATEFLDRLIKITESLKKEYENEGMQILLLDSCIRFIKLFEFILDRLKQSNFINSLIDIKIIFEFLVQQEKFNFTGDQLSSVQIMGVLETRLLDFDNVIITNVNEGTLPISNTPFSIIPFDVRKKFSMKTFIEKDHLYAYHFFRLLQRAKNIFLLYNSTTEGLFSAEMSRFLIQLDYFKQPLHDIKISNMELEIPIQNIQPKKIDKSQIILDHLELICVEGFSPSSLTQYIRSPYKFYEQRMLKVNPKVEINDELSALDKGTLMHEALQMLYQPYISDIMISNSYDEMLKNLQEILKELFNKINKKEAYKTGKNALVFRIMEEVLKRFLISEKLKVINGDQIKILALEHEFSKNIFIKELDKKIKFKGAVDRIDIYNDTLRFVDYKTGNISESDLTFSNWEELRIYPKKNPLFQVMLYAYLLKNEFHYDKIIAGVIPLKTFKNNFLAVSQKENKQKRKNLKIEGEVFPNFEKELFKLICEIFDPSIPFTEKN